MWVPRSTKALGIDADAEIEDRLGRPSRLNTGWPMDFLFLNR
jgi:hypothetical protein